MKTENSEMAVKIAEILQDYCWDQECRQCPFHFDDEDEDCMFGHSPRNWDINQARSNEVQLKMEMRDDR